MPLASDSCRHLAVLGSISGSGILMAPRNSRTQVHAQRQADTGRRLVSFLQMQQEIDRQRGESRLFFSPFSVVK